MTRVKTALVAIAGWACAAVAQATPTTLDLTTFTKSIGGGGSASVTSTLATLNGTASLTSMVTNLLSFEWQFYAGDYLPYNDYGQYSLSGSAVTLANVASVGQNNTTAWATYLFSSPVSGNLQFAVQNLYDNAGASSLRVRNVMVDVPAPAPVALLNLSSPAPVPEPASLATVAAALAAMGLVARRRKAVPQA